MVVNAEPNLNQHSRSRNPETSVKTRKTDNKNKSNKKLCVIPKRGKKIRLNRLHCSKQMNVMIQKETVSTVYKFLVGERG